MASSFALPVPDLVSLSTRRHRISLSRYSLSRLTSPIDILPSLSKHGLACRAIRGEGIVGTREREAELLQQVNGTNGTAAGTTNRIVYGSSGSPIEDNGNGGMSVSEREEVGSNGSLVKYVESWNDGVSEADVEQGRKKRIEEIGKEDAWFKRADQQYIQVSVAPGGRWSRFKTYSTIQRSMEIWGFVITFIFKAWLNNQKFSYRGGMTEEKKTLRRKALAKWLKETILRLGPTFIKIGQQFSTRVDILAQEYVDRLSELQDQVPPFPSETAISIIEEELGAQLDDIFDQFDYEPIAAASLGNIKLFLDPLRWKFFY